MTITTKPVGTPSVPNTVSSEAANNPAIPNTVSSESVVNPAIPNTVTSKATGTVAIPNTVTSEAAGAVAIPNTVTSQAAVSPAVPNTISTAVAAALPRTLTPLVSMDFAAGCYAQCGNPRTFDELFTYSRNTSASFVNRRVDCNGGYEYFIDRDFVGNVENLVTYSEAFDNAAWTKTNSSVTANNSKGIGSQLMDRLQEDSTAAANHLAQSASTTVTSGATVTISVDVKADDRYWILLYEAQGGDGKYFNVRDGVIGGDSGTPLTGKIEHLGGDVYRCSITSVVPATAAVARVYLASSDGVISYNGDGTSGLFIDRAQLTESTKPQPYVKTISSAVTETFSESIRQEYDPATSESLGVLIEGASTNLFVRSEEFDNAAWIKLNANTGVNDIESPDGTTSADKLEASATASISPSFRQTVTSVATSVYTVSFYVKASEAAHIQVYFSDGHVANDPRINFDLISGSVVNQDADIDSASIKRTGDFYRVSATVEAVGTSLTMFAALIQGDNDTRGKANSWTAGDGLYIWGAQCEQKEKPSSYIYTTSSTVSRADDDPRASAIGNFNESEYTIVVLGETSETTGNADFISITDGTNNNRVQLSGGINSIDVNGVSGAAVQFNGNTGGPISTQEKSALTFKINDVDAYFQGESFYTDNSAIASSGLTTIYIGNLNAASEFLNGHIKTISIYDKKLTAQEVSLL